MVSFKSCLGKRNRSRPFPRGPLGFALGEEIQVSALLWPSQYSSTPALILWPESPETPPNLLSPNRDHRCDPAYTVPGWLPLQTSCPAAGASSLSVPTVSWQEPCRLGRRGPTNGMAPIWDVEVASTLWFSDPHIVCTGRAG